MKPGAAASSPLVGSAPWACGRSRQAALIWGRLRTAWSERATGGATIDELGDDAVLAFTREPREG